MSRYPFGFSLCSDFLNEFFFPRKEIKRLLNHHVLLDAFHKPYILFFTILIYFLVQLFIFEDLESIKFFYTF